MGALRPPAPEVAASEEVVVQRFALDSAANPAPLKRDPALGCCCWLLVAVVVVVGCCCWFDVNQPLGELCNLCG